VPIGPAPVKERVNAAYFAKFPIFGFYYLCYFSLLLLLHKSVPVIVIFS
jgi:hypothetical protein